MILLTILFSMMFIRRKGELNFLPAIPALIAVGQAGIQYAQAQKQKKQAKNLKNSNYIPAAVSEAVGNARAEASAPTSAAYNRGIDSARQVTASTVNNIKSIGGNANQMQQAVADADAREKTITKDLEVSNEQLRMQKSSELNNLLQVKGGYEKSSFDDMNAAKSALTGAAIQNQYSAATNLMEGAVYGADALSGTGKTKPPGSVTDPSALYASGVRTPQYNQNGRSGYKYRNMNYSPAELAILRSKGLL